MFTDFIVDSPFRDHPQAANEEKSFALHNRWMIHKIVIEITALMRI